MDDVPVKIVERYKPPPIVYQLPQSIANRLATQDVNYYNESPQFNYDFQLERKVLSQVQCWRQMRQREIEARQERQERRKLEQQRAIEAQQKEMLGAVQYPNADDFSSSSSLDGSDEEGGKGEDVIEHDNNMRNNDDDESRAPTTESATTETSEIAVAASTINTKTTNTDANEVNAVQKSINSNQTTSNFHNILQPTVLSQQIKANLSSTATKKNVSLNYADFEYDNSSPFDNIELNTINDLDILAQVLHNTQLEQNATGKVDQIEQPPLPATAEVQSYDKKAFDEEVSLQDANGVVHLAVLEANKADLDKVDFNSLNQCDDVAAANIPIPSSNNSNCSNTNNLTTQQIGQQTFSNNLNQYHNYSTVTRAATPTVPSQPQTTPQAFQQLQHHASQTIQAYHLQQTNTPQVVVPHFQAAHYCDYQLQQQQQANNQNYLFSPYSNGHSSLQTQPHNHNYITYHGTPTHHHQQQNQQHNQKSNIEYMTAQGVFGPVMSVDMLEPAALKSKSVPDIMRELKSELLINSELKRSRNLSHNVDDNNHPHKELTTAPPSSLPKSVYTELTAPARKLAQRISTMGFPLERVAKVVNICGVDDKKIIEHLIHLSELMDLGFEETKISAALLKFDNNKDKALDYLIS